MNDSQTKKNKEKTITIRLKEVAKETDSITQREEFIDIVDEIIDLWTENRKAGTTWTPGFQGEVAELLKLTENRASLYLYLAECEEYALKSATSGFYASCSMLSKIHILTEEFIPLSEIVHPNDIETLEVIEETYLNYADDIPPIPHDKIPSWVPESHSWWRIPTRHDMSKEEIKERLYEICPEDWDPNY